jgi:hypothetical protein
MFESQLVRNFDESHGYGKSHPGGAGRPGVKENGVFALAEKGNVGVAIDHDLSRVLMKKNLSLLVEPKPHHREMEQQKVKATGSLQTDTEGHRLRPHGTGRVGVSPNVDRLADPFQFRNEIKVSHVTRMENERRTIAFEDREQVGVRFAVRIGENRNDNVLGIRQISHSGCVSTSHRLP